MTVTLPKMALISVIAAISFASPTLAAPRERAARDIAKAGRETSINANAQDDVFASGRSVQVAGDISDTLFAAGRDIAISANVGDDVALVGRMVTVTGRTGGNLFATGSTLRLPGPVNGDAYLAGREVRPGPIKGDLNVMAHEVWITEPVTEELRASADTVRINTTIGGNAKITAEHLRLGPDARIAGKLLLRSDNPPYMSPTAFVTGGVVRLPLAEDGDASASHILESLALLTFAIWFVGAGCYLLAPVMLSEAVSALRHHPLRICTLGLATAVLTMPLAILLAVTLVGLPFAFALSGFYAFCLLAALPISALALAMLLVQWRSGLDSLTRRTVLPMLLTPSLALALVLLVPIAHTIVAVAATIIGFGLFCQSALIIVRRDRRIAAA